MARMVRKERKMPLTVNERKLLAQMEEAFIADDPRLVSTLTGNRLYPRGTVLFWSYVGWWQAWPHSLGGLIAQITPIGILDFYLLIGVTLAISALSGLRGPRGTPRKRGRSNLNLRLEDRWERR